jgi:hypothetical protein
VHAHRREHVDTLVHVQELKESDLALWEFFMNEKLQELQQFRELVVRQMHI